MKFSLKTGPRGALTNALAAMLLLGASLHVAVAQDARPNILFIMSDDHAEASISAYGSELLHTPNIDRIADEGVLFRNSFVTNSICGPSRAVMLTGKHSHLNGFRSNNDLFDGTQPTWPQYLQDAGYQTAVVGKWHLGSKPVGFDYWEVLRGQGHYYAPDFITNVATDITVEVEVTDESGDVVEVELESHYEGAYSTTKIGDLALAYLEGRDRSKPFALMFNHKAPHRNWMPDVDELGDIDTSRFEVPASFYDDYAGRPAAAVQDMEMGHMWLAYDLKLERHRYDEDPRDPDDTWWDNWMELHDRMSDEQKEKWDAYYAEANEEYDAVKRDPEALLEWRYRRYMHDYLGSVHSMDRNIGRILDYLDAEGLTDNTIVIYTSDQGFYLGEHRWFDKRFMYEESMRTPLVMRYPAGVEAGHVVTEMVQNLDYAPTLLEMAGVPLPDDLQGRSLLPLATGEAESLGRDSLYYRYYEGNQSWHAVAKHYGVRTRTHKLIRFSDIGVDHWELFDLVNDPHELRNVYDDPGYARIRRGLHEELDRLQAYYGDEQGE